MLDLVVRNGRVVTSVGIQHIDLGVYGGKFVVFKTADAPERLDGIRVIDAKDALVVPGGIDPHVHTNSPMPTLADGSCSYGPDRVSAAAAYGGTTTLADFAIWTPGESLHETFDRKTLEWRGCSYVDYALHGTFREPEIPFEILEQVPDAVADGHATYKVWMTNTTPGRRWQKTDLGHIWGLMEKTASAGAMLCVHAEDDEIVMYSYKRLQHHGKVGMEYMSQAHSVLSEQLSFQRVITLAGHVGAPIYVMHVSAAVGVDAIRRARGEGQPVYGECLQHYAHYSDEVYRQADGGMYHTYPSLKSPADRDAMWPALISGTLSTIATDEVCTDFHVKMHGSGILDAPGGHVGVEVRMAVAYTEGVSKRGISHEKFVDLTARNAARILGAYPQKGEIAIGSDADLVLLDTTVSRTISAKDLHEADYSPWEGYRVAAWPTMTILRGNVLVENGRLTAHPPAGELLKRVVATSVSQRVGL